MSTTATAHPILCLTMNPSVDLATDTEQVVPTHKLRCGPTLHDAGGGGVNVARVLTRLGGRCLSLSPPGRTDRSLAGAAHARRGPGRAFSGHR